MGPPAVPPLRIVAHPVTSPRGRPTVRLSFRQIGRAATVSERSATHPTPLPDGHGSDPAATTERPLPAQGWDSRVGQSYGASGEEHTGVRAGPAGWRLPPGCGATKRARPALRY